MNAVVHTSEQHFVLSWNLVEVKGETELDFKNE